MLFRFSFLFRSCRFPAAYGWCALFPPGDMKSSFLVLIRYPVVLHPLLGLVSVLAISQTAVCSYPQWMKRG